MQDVAVAALKSDCCFISSCWPCVMIVFVFVFVLCFPIWCLSLNSSQSLREMNHWLGWVRLCSGSFLAWNWHWLWLWLLSWRWSSFFVCSVSICNGSVHNLCCITRMLLDRKHNHVSSLPFIVVTLIQVSIFLTRKTSLHVYLHEILLYSSKFQFHLVHPSRLSPLLLFLHLSSLALGVTLIIKLALPLSITSGSQ